MLFLPSAELSVLGWRTVRVTLADCLAAHTRPTTVTDQSTRHSGGLSAVQVLESKQKRTSSGLTSTVSGGLSATWCRTVRRQTPRKHIRTNTFWTLCSQQWQTVRSRLPDCRPVKEQKSNNETEALDLLSPDPRTVRGYTTDCPQIAQKQEQSAPKTATSLRSMNLWPNLHQLPRNLVSLITRQ
jgi:hypothetical protein